MEKAKSYLCRITAKNIVNRYEWLFRHDWIDGWLNESLDNQKKTNSTYQRVRIN